MNQNASSLLVQVAHTASAQRLHHSTEQQCAAYMRRSPSAVGFTKNVFEVLDEKVCVPQLIDFSEYYLHRIQ